jgi:hypothetical protein
VSKEKDGVFAGDQLIEIGASESKAALSVAARSLLVFMAVFRIVTSHCVGHARESGNARYFNCSNVDGERLDVSVEYTLVYALQDAWKRGRLYLART